MTRSFLPLAHALRHPGISAPVLSPVLYAVLCAATVANASGALPEFRNLRFEEQWPAYPDSGLKHILVSDTLPLRISTALQERVRFETWRNFQFARPLVNDDSLLYHRIRAHLDVRTGNHLRFFFELKNSHVFGRQLPGGRRVSDADSLALQNGFVELQLPISWMNDTRVRLGRQEILFGKQRLLSPADWSNTRRSFDGIRLDTTKGDRYLSAFWVRPVRVRKYESNISDDSTLLYGLYYGDRIPVLSAGLEMYLLGRHSKKNFPATTGITRDQRYTLGGRMSTKNRAIPWDFEMEAAWQLGERGEADIDAWMLTTELHYRWPSLPYATRSWLAVDIASGQQGDTGKVTLFDPLFPTGHAHLGYIDHIGRFNIVDYRLGLDFKLSQRLGIGFEAHHFNRYNRNDAVYTPAGAVLVPGTGSKKREIGSEIDVTAKYAINRHWQAQLGYSVFFAGDVIRDTGKHRSIHFGYLSLQYTY